MPSCVPVAIPPGLQTIAFHNPSSFKEEKVPLVRIDLLEGKSEQYRAQVGFYKALADHLHEGVKIRKEDVLINFVEVPKDKWSFGNGQAQYVMPPK